MQKVQAVSTRVLQASMYHLLARNKKDFVDFILFFFEFFSQQVRLP